MSNEKIIVKEIKVKAERGDGPRGPYWYIRCPICKTMKKVSYGEKYERWEIDAEGDRIHAPSVTEDTEEECLHCGAVLTVVWADDDDKEKMRREIEKKEKDERDFQNERKEKNENFRERRKREIEERERVWLDAVREIYGGYPRWVSLMDKIPMPDTKKYPDVIDAEYDWETVFQKIAEKYGAETAELVMEDRKFED